MKMAVIKTGGKQYLVGKDSELLVDNLNVEAGKTLEIDKLADIDSESHEVKLGTPVLPAKVKVEIIESIKGDKIHVARFKAKSRYRKVRGFRARLSRIKIVAI